MPDRFRLPTCRLVGATTAMAMLLAGCATLPAETATAFKTLASADKASLDDLATQDLAARVSVAQSLLANNEGVVGLENCESMPAESAPPAGAAAGSAAKPNASAGSATPKAAVAPGCAVTFSANGNSQRLQLANPNARALLGAIVRYSSQMADLAEAKHLDTVKAKAEAAAGSVKALALVAGVPGAIANVVIDGAVFLGNAGLRRKRNAALLKNASAAQPVIEAAAKKLDHIAGLMADDVRVGTAQRLRDLNERIEADRIEERRLVMRRPGRQLTPWRAGRIELLRERRAAAMAEMVSTSDAMNRARAQQPIFVKLVEAHAALITKLEHPELSTESALADINAVLAILDELSPPKAGK